jgi:hypothetical protein
MITLRIPDMTCGDCASTIHTAEKVEPAPERPEKSGGCCRGSRKAAPVDAGQAQIAAGDACCG